MSLAQGRVDCIADRAGLKFNLLAGESQHSNSLFHHPLITNRVIPLVLFCPMRRSVNFDNQFCFDAIEVGRAPPPLTPPPLSPGYRGEGSPGMLFRAQQGESRATNCG